MAEMDTTGGSIARALVGLLEVGVAVRQENAQDGLVHGVPEEERGVERGAGCSETEDILRHLSSHLVSIVLLRDYNVSSEAEEGRSE
jgi:hypothetical protein